MICSVSGSCRRLLVLTTVGFDYCFIVLNFTETTNKIITPTKSTLKLHPPSSSEAQSP
jgi:hypothetical protein